jgi:hypothetical protein
LLKRLAEVPIVVRSSLRAATKIGAVAGTLLGFALFMPLAAALYSLTDLGGFWSLAIGLTLVPLSAGLFAHLMRRSGSGHEFQFDAAGVHYSRFGVSQWSLSWEDFRIEGHGLLGNRKRIVFPNGNRVAFPEHYFDSMSDAKAAFSVFTAFEVKKPPGKVDWIKLGGAAVAGGVCAIVFSLLGNKTLERAFPPDGGILRGELLLAVFFSVLGVIGVLFFVLPMLVIASNLEVHQDRAGGSKHGPLWVDYVRSQLRTVPAVEIEPGKRYKYLDPERLKGHIGAGWALVLFGGLFLAVSLFPSADAGDGAIWIIRAFALGLILAPIGVIRRDRALARSLGYVYWVEGGRLHVSNGGRVESFAVVPVRTVRGKPEAKVPKFMVWWEEYENERGRIRLDRRFLWPVD